MPNRAHRSNAQKLVKKTSEPNSPTTSITAHHGDILFLPSETLTQIAASLDPKSLLALGQVNRQLRDHVSDDHTWGIAFKAQFLKLSPETEPSQTDLLLLRRSETSWRKEFLNRWNLNRRFSKCRNATIRHVPVNSTVSDVILLPDKSSILTSSLVYGIVSRSFAFTGKVLKGYLDAHGTFNGQGIGNPNGEFAPDVSAIALHSAGGGSAKIAWGFLNGDVAITAAPKVMEVGKIAKFVRCRPADAHESMVSVLAFGEAKGTSGSTLVSASTGGSIKLWEARRMKCLWTDNVRNAAPTTVSINTNLGVKCLSYCANSGAVVAAASNGDIFVWTGIDTEQVIASSQSSDTAMLESISPQYYGRFASPQGSNGGVECEPLSIAIQSSPPGSLNVHIAVFYTHSSHFWKLVASPSSGKANALEFSTTRFAAGPVGKLTSSFINFSRKESRHDAAPQSPRSAQRSTFPRAIGGPQSRRTPLGSRQRSFVVAGDSMGQLFLWDWEDDTEGILNFAPARGRKDRVERQFYTQILAHEDGALSSIDMDGPILATGSDGGTIKLWDALTFEHIRTLVAPTVRSPRDPDRERVSRLILNEDVMVASIGTQIVAWRAVIAKTGKMTQERGKKTLRTRANPISKWQEQVGMRRELRETRSEIDEEHQSVRESYGQEREQRQTLAQLGLDEVEAVEYVLMLSRDEEIARQTSLLSSAGEDGSAAGTSVSRAHPTKLANQDGLLFNMTDDFDIGFPSSSQNPPVKRDEDTSQFPFISRASSRHASVSPHSRIAPMPSPRHTPSLSPLSYSPTGSTKLQVSPRQRLEPMVAGSSDMPSSPVSVSRSTARQIPSCLPLGGTTSFGNGAVNSRSVPASSMHDWVLGSISPPTSASTSPSSPAPRGGSVSSLSRSVASTTGQRSWSDIARSTLPVGTVSVPRGQGPPSSDATSQVMQAQRPSHSLLSASLAANQGPAADSEDAQLQYAFHLSLAEAQDQEGA